jgi:hypothetical protein
LLRGRHHHGARPDLTDGPPIGPIDLNVSGSRSISYQARQAFAADDPLPLFLSDEAEYPQMPDAGKHRHRVVIRPRILTAGILAASAAVLVFGILTVENPVSIFPNAKASLSGAVVMQPGAPPPPVETVGAIPGAAPTRDQIAVALRSAHQGQPEVRPAPAAAAPERRLDGDELAALMKRADGLIAIGDIAAARLLLEHAADAQEPSAALLLAQTYDPAVLGKSDARSITPDPMMARSWYRKAAQLGSLNAQQRLAQMQN